MHRYYDPARGRFTTPDPSGADAANLADPGTWNMYAYVNGDPINSNDPDGLVACGALVNQGVGQSVGSIMSTYNDLGYLAQTVWHESGPMYKGDIANDMPFVTEQAYIATALVNRYDIARGTLTAYTARGGTVNSNAFGGSGASLTSVILQAAGNNQSWGIYTNGQLDNMATLQKVLNTDTSVGAQVGLPNGGSVNSECFSVLSAVTEALYAQAGFRTEPNGVILTYWNLATNSSPARGNTATVPKIRASGNTFYGYFSTQQPKPIRHPGPRLP